MHWKLAAHRAFTRDRNARMMASIASVGYDTAARILEAQEALVQGVGLLAAHERRYDGKRVSEADWKGLK